MQEGSLLAAVDLGSNSFRLEIARYAHGQLQRVQYLKETGRQGAGLDEQRQLTPEALQRGWDCLARFAERLRGFAPGQVRAVATQTLREARNSEVFTTRGSAILGFPIAVISGPEEARLIYQGVAHLLPASDERRLVLDIGGRSTELILGQRFTAQAVASQRVGSVSWSGRYFADGALTPAAFAAAEVAAKAVFAEVLAQFPRASWDQAYGSSGTVGAVGEILAAMGQPAGLITRAALDELLDKLLRAGHVERIRLDALKDDRRPVIGGGLAVLRAVMDALGMDRLQVAQGALRQGALYDLLAREQPAIDLRGQAVAAQVARFGADPAQAARVAQTAGQLLAQVAPRGAQAGQTLHWAAQLHEIGACIAHSGYHRHGAYILEHTDAAGFTQSELARLALLVRAHRGKLRKLELDWDDADVILPLACLRLAVALCHARRDPDLGGLRLTHKGQRLALHLRATWAQAYPQSAHLLQEECGDWQRTPWSLELVEQ